MASTRRTALAAAGPALAAALLVTGVAGCGSSDTGASGAGDHRASGSGGGSADGHDADSGKGSGGADGSSGGTRPDVKLPAKLPTSLPDVKNWKWDDWSDWAKQQVFKNPRIASLWTPKRMAAAEDRTVGVPKDTGNGKPGTDPVPRPVLAKKAPRPYTKTSGALGKLFFDGPGGSYVCSATVVSDPKHPGKSNLVWTAGHCMHGGKGKGFYRNFAFVPAYNNKGSAKSQADAPTKAVAPYGRWWASAGETSTQWVKSGGETGGNGSQYDYSIMRVVPPKGTHRSLEETVGASVPVWFNAHHVSAISAYGYPAAPPYSGLNLEHCDAKPRHLSIDPKAPNDYRIGCTMTGGSSGGGWFAKKPDGTTALVSNTSIGPAAVPIWLAGPYLGDVAKSVFDDFTTRNAH